MGFQWLKSFIRNNSSLHKLNFRPVWYSQLYFYLNLKLSKMFLEKTGLNLFFIVLMLSASSVTAQKTFSNYAFDSSTTYIMKLLDRTEYIGKFLQKDSTTVVIITNSASKVEIPFSKLKSIEAVKNTNLKKGVYWFPNPNATRYFFGPSAFSLKKGEGYYQNSYLLLNSVNVGI